MPDDEAPHAAQALWIVERGRCELRGEKLPDSGPGEALVESLYGAISRGTERLILDGRVPESERERMRGPRQEGDFPFPVKYGYAVVGRVAKGPDDLLGRTVFCLHPHQDRFVARAEDLIALPDALPAERAVLAANMETALNLVWDAGILPGDRVGIVGGGLVGLLAGWLVARIPGVDACLVDVDAGRRAGAEALGLVFAAPEAAFRDCDVVLHASASAAGLGTALDMAGREARIVEASWYGEGATCVPLGGAFHARRLSITASQVGSVPPARRARWSNRRRLEKAMALLADERLDTLVSGETAFCDLPARYADILRAPGTLCQRIRYR